MWARVFLKCVIIQPVSFFDTPHLYTYCSCKCVRQLWQVNLMFIGPCIIVIVEEWKTNMMSLAILFQFLCAQHVSDINISIFRSLRLCCWITTLVVLFSVHCVLEIWCAWSLQNEHHPKPAATNLQHTTNWEQGDRCGNSTTQSQAPEDGYINVRNMLST